ncbi:uncharacterized protein LOC133866996 [Alnus glutinosa]|uniref:uncharacterized protein LOC133866996 n=1 Tax=Alnus glutinosa TaxID=3517 RepID=UPI002D770894|nr:uncharacterized protein LOC133866996 [Alnus glutinosa]
MCGIIRILVISFQIMNPNGLTQVVRALVLVEGLKVRIPLSETISKSQSAGEARILRDLCGGGALHESDVYLTGVGTRSVLPCMGSSSSKKVSELRVSIEFHLFNMNMCYDVLQVTMILQMMKLLMRKMRMWIEKQAWNCFLYKPSCYFMITGFHRICSWLLITVLANEDGEVMPAMNSLRPFSCGLPWILFQVYA